VSLKQRYDREVARLRREDVDFQALELMLAVSERMRQLMAEQGISQAELAARLDVSPQYVSKLLHDDECNLTLRQIARIAGALSATVAWDFRYLTDIPRWICATDTSTLQPPSKEPPTNALALAA
jgi:transcriptional regulator with XRE-family HTH domain